jgi:phosphohistidine phosphatase
MRKVILLRHAKASRDDPAIDDHDRPLNARGRAAAPLMGRWLAERGHVPDTVLCSSSERTKETVRRIAEVLPGWPEPAVEGELYHASPEAMRARLARLAQECRTVMLVGHNPGLASLLRELSDGRENPRCRRAYEHFPTGAAAVLELELETWSDIGFAKARLVDFATPRQLTEA